MQTKYPIERFVDALGCPNRKPIRLKDYNYSTPGEYFVTICTHEKHCMFGEVIEEQMQLNENGKIAARCWEEIPRHFPDVEVDEYVIMPNHVHGIIILNEPVGTRHAVSLQKTERFGKPINRSIPTIIRSYKSAATKGINEMRRIQGMSVWQSRFYERIIRNEKELNNIRDYIINNPLKWSLDEENPSNRII